MPWRLISATPSPYARKVRIALQEKNLPFELQTEVPWDHTTKTPQYNPLEKLPVLIFDDDATSDSTNGNIKTPTAIYESHYILDWLETKYPDPPLLPQDVDERLFAKRVEVVADGVCDAIVLALFESKREKEKQSQPWMERQQRKIAAGLRQLHDWVTSLTLTTTQPSNHYLVSNTLTLADIALISLLGFMGCRFPHNDWQTRYPRLKEYWDWHEESRESFRTTKPKPQVFSDAVV